MNVVSRFVVASGALLAAGAASAADYSAITTAMSDEQAAITGVIVAVAGVLAVVYAVKKGASLALSAIRG